MSLRKKILLGLLAIVILAIASFVLWAGSQVTRHEKEVTYPSLEVLRNPYLAAEHFLQKQGVSFQRSKRLKSVLRTEASGQTLLLLGSGRWSMTSQQTEQLLQWVSFGGHIIVVAERKWDEEKGQSGDLLLDNLGIEQYLAKDLAAEKPAGKKNERYPKLTKLYLENETSPAYISFDTRYHLFDSQDRAHAWANSGDGITHMLQLHYGDGLITVLTDPWIWNNNNIDKYDNAWLLWYLTQDHKKVTLFDRFTVKQQQPNLIDALLQYFPEALAALALLLVLILWHKAQRQGALLPAESRARRQLEEHLRASADFLLRHQGRAHLIELLQQDIKKHAAVRQSGFTALDDNAQHKMLAQLARKSLAQVRVAMQRPAKRQSAADFSHQVKDLQTLRNAL